MPGNETIYKSPRAYLPIVWADNNVTQGSDNVMAAAAIPAGLDEVPMPRAGSVTAIAVVMSRAITSGGITISLRKNGSNTANQATIAAGEGTTKVVDLPPGAADYVAGDTVGLRLQAASGLAPNSQIDLAVYLETQNV